MKHRNLEGTRGMPPPPFMKIFKFPCSEIASAGFCSGALRTSETALQLLPFPILLNLPASAL